MKLQLLFTIPTLMLLATACESIPLTVDSQIQDEMVLQRDHKINITGTVTPGSEVFVKFGNIQVSAMADANGKYNAVLPELKASKKESDLVITDSFKHKVVKKNIVVGDVWLCSGQSNMEFPVRVSSTAKETLAQKPNHNIRLFYTGKKYSLEEQSSVKGNWSHANSSNVSYFSAVCFYFGEKLQRDLNIPIGLIDSSWGGTPIKAWSVSKFDWNMAAPKEHPEWQESALYNGMIAPHHKLPIRGINWYQGEADAWQAKNYRVMLTQMIRDWRKKWNDNSISFNIVQLANFTYGMDKGADSALAEFREAQLQVSQEVENVGIAVTTDIGHKTDIHPTDKKTVGERLALQALNKSYGEEGVVADGPLFFKQTFEGNKIRLHFKSVVSVLQSTSGDNALTDFMIAGEDHVWHVAQAQIEKSSEYGHDTVVVHCDQVQKPIAVRYGWNENPLMSLRNEAGLPASSFRTDNWNGIGK